MLCHVPDSFIAGTSKVTVVSVRNESRKDYGKKETITLGYVDNDSNQSLEMLVDLYNRQSKIYRVELVAYKNQEQDVTACTAAAPRRGPGSNGCPFHLCG